MIILFNITKHNNPFGECCYCWLLFFFPFLKPSQPHDSHQVSLLSPLTCVSVFRYYYAERATCYCSDVAETSQLVEVKRRNGTE